jgi:hypothetical protein
MDVYKEIAGYLTAPEDFAPWCLVPDLSVNQRGVSYKVYFRKLAEENPKGIFKYFEKENLFSFADEVG